MTAYRIPILRIQGFLLASLQGDLTDSVAERFQQDVLQSIEKHGSPGLILDITGLELVDTYVARVLADTGRMARLMGAETVLVGMRPEVAATLVRMGFALDDIHTALDIDDGLVELDRLTTRRR